MSASTPGPAGPLLGWAAGLAALTAWGGMVAEPRAFMVPSAVGGLAVAGAGLALSRLRITPAIVVLVQLLVALLALNVAVARDQSLGGVVPTPASVERVASLVVLGGQALGYYTAPVEAFSSATTATLTAAGLTLLWTITALAQGLSRPALVALPLLIAVSVPITVLDDAVSPAAFVVAGFAYLMLLMTDRHERWHGAAWVGEDVPGAATARPVPRAHTAWQVAAVSVGAALLLAPLVPVDELSRRGEGGDGPGGTGGTVRLTTVNPFVTLQRDLLEQTDTPMVFARTDSPDPTYLRSTVLDVFTEDGWSASQRELSATNGADGAFPAPPGLRAGAGGETSRWELELDPRYSTSWLPLPYPVREVAVTGNWRYDERFLDVAVTTGSAATGLEYQALALAPSISAQDLDRAIRAPASVRVPHTALPEGLPPVVEEVARRVTDGAETPYQRAVALQDWFRGAGDFRYSLESRPGSGMQLLADFVTDDRVGYCEQFAAAMAAMGRALDIPSRVAVGFLRPERLADGDLVYTSDSRHAWVEMYFSGAGWIRFEPTPAQVSGASPSYTRDRVDEESDASPPALPDAEERRLGDRLGLDDAGSADTDGWSGPAAGVLLAGLAAIFLALAAPAFLRRAQRRRRLSSSDSDDLAEGVWAELRASALDAGVTWDDRRSPRQQAGSLHAQVVADDDAAGAAESLEELLQQVELGRYAPVLGRTRTGAEARDRLLATWEQWRVLLLAHAERRPVAGHSKLRRRLLPPSLTRSWTRSQ